MAAPKSEVTETSTDPNVETQGNNEPEPEPEPDVHGHDYLKQVDELKESWNVEQCDLSQMFNGYVDEAQIIDLRPLREYKKCHIHTAIHVDPQNLETSAISQKKRNNICFDVMGSGYGLEDYKKVQDHCLGFKSKRECTFKMAKQQFDFTEFQRTFPSLCVSSNDEQDDDPQNDESSSQRKCYPNLIIPHELYLGDMWNRKQPESLKEIGITHIVDATMEKFENNDGFEILKIKLPDSTQAAEQMAGHFENAVQFIGGALKDKEHRVFVHCQMGVSRSTTLVLAYLMMARGYTLYDGYSLCKRSRPRIRPNDGFFEQLKLLEKQVHGKSTADLIEEEGLRQGECLMM